MTIEEIRELIKVVAESGVAELELQRGENRVRIRFGGRQVRQDVYVSAAPPVVATGVGGAPVAVQQASSHPAPAEPVSEDPAMDPTLVPVKSPIVGTFYEAPSPGAEPFVKVGDVISPGQVLCIIESMKLMNEIESEVGGKIVRRLVENAQPVEYGETLFLVKPA